MPAHAVRIALLLAGVCAAGPTAAGETEQLLAEVPDGWVKAIDRNVGDLHIAEYLPPDASEDWVQKLSFEALSGAELPDPLVVAAGLADEQRKVCNDFADDTIFAGFENGYPAVVHMMQCGQSNRTGKPLLTMLKVIQGNQALYTITRIWRLPPAAGAEGERGVAVDQAELGAWSQTLRGIKLCDAALPAHPCE